MATQPGIIATAAPPNQDANVDDWYTSYMNSAPDPMKTYDAAQAAASTWSVAPDQTVQNQIQGIIKADSPLMQMARTQSLQSQAAKGLGNSSLAIGAGQTAVYGAAMPIASQDASTYANAAKTNAELGTQVSIANAGFKNDASKFNVGASNTSSMQQRDLIAQNRLQQTGIAADLTKQQNDIAAQKAMQQSAISADWNKQQSFQNYDAALKTAMQATDQAGRVELQNLDSATRKALADIEARYKTGMQTSSSMANTYQSMIDNISRVMADPDMDGPAKQAAIGNLTTLYNGALENQEAISGLDLGELLDPSVFQTGGGAAPTAPSGTAPTAPSGTPPYPYQDPSTYSSGA